MGYIDSEGLEQIWGKIKSLVSSSSGGTAPADYIMETGTEVKGDCNPWYYEKWNSGKAVCWCSGSVGTTNKTGTVNSWNYRTVSYTFPSGLFTSVSDVHVDAKWGTGVSWGNCNSVTTTTVTALYLSNQTSGSLSFRINAVGRWK